MLQIICSLGCSKSLKDFPRYNKTNRSDYSGYDVENWTLRIGAEHKLFAEESLTCNTAEKRSKCESLHGVRYNSELFRLPYFDPVLMHVTDPMHSLMLGIAKHASKTWIEVGKLNDAKLLQIDNHQKLMKIPTDVGRIVHSNSKSHKSMKADEWENWTLIYSMFCLRNILPDRDITVWSFFVKACMMLCKRSITIAEISQGHELLTMYCKQFEILYGTNNCSKYAPSTTFEGVYKRF